jgi:hypothetical protein
LDEEKPDPARPSPGKTSLPPHPERSAYAKALIAELRLLVRTIANDPNKRLNTLRLSYQLPDTDSSVDLTFDKVLNKLSEIEGDEIHRAALDQIAFLQAVRDALVAMTAPATGLTICYTALVSGGQRSTSVESAFDLASQAYGRLTVRAKLHRWLVWLLMAVAVGCMGLATWEATAAALGRNLLQNMSVLRSQQGAMMAEKLKLETSTDKPLTEADLSSDAGEKALSSAWLPLCDRYQNRRLIVETSPTARQVPVDDGGKPLALAVSPAERDLCGRDTILRVSIDTLHMAMKSYLTAWPSVIGGIPGSIAQVLPALSSAPPPCPPADRADKSAVEPPSLTCDFEYFIAPRLQVTTNYILPLVFGFLGSLLYVLLDHFTKLRANTLGPKDLSLMPLRLILGLVIAACVSLLVSSYSGGGSITPGEAGGPPAIDSMVASLTLSASGLGFLAGFGAEAVFTLLQALTERVFAAQK